MGSSEDKQGVLGVNRRQKNNVSRVLIDVGHHIMVYL
jgi:hypothetical protein